jgi:nitrite reductase/ring-hydroxylating ferredoxin subunit
MTSEPIGLSNDLAPRQVMRARIGQHDVAVWRSTSGVINAWENRCPHRGMRLSHGFVRGESLACAYHGWHYNSAGYCHYIPAHPELTPPKTVRPTIFNVSESDGLIWLDTESDVQTIPLPAGRDGLRSLTLDCEPQALVTALSQTPPPADCEIDRPPEYVGDSPLILTLNAADTPAGLVIALQQPQTGCVIAHALIDASFSVDIRIALSRWLESVRRNAETSSAEQT